ncbi:hypothetical protein OBV_11740 [Oscillibacter valericigenes Sjm18-20]|nr:hypothetical protein OBV_11740 [Oscillibacter valericigenes Sjm18-20]
MGLKYPDIYSAYSVAAETAAKGSFTAAINGVPVICAAASDTVTLTAAPASGYALSAWNVFKTGDTGTMVGVSGSSYARISGNGGSLFYGYHADHCFEQQLSIVAIVVLFLVFFIFFPHHHHDRNV